MGEVLFSSGEDHTLLISDVEWHLNNGTIAGLHIHLESSKCSDGPANLLIPVSKYKMSCAIRNMLDYIRICSGT